MDKRTIAQIAKNDVEINGGKVLASGAGASNGTIGLPRVYWIMGEYENSTAITAYYWAMDHGVVQEEPYCISGFVFDDGRFGFHESDLPKSILKKVVQYGYKDIYDYAKYKSEHGWNAGA